MGGAKQRIEELEELLRTTPYNKATQKAIGRYKAQLAKLKTELEEKQSGSGGHGYAVRKAGDRTVALLGFPSAGKSTLLNSLTGAESETGSYAFTTLQVVPGMLKHRHANIQVLDVPGIVEGAAVGKGRGKEVLAVLRNADLVMILLDPEHPEHVEKLRKEVYDAGIRLNKEKPDVKITKKGKDGLSISSTVSLDMDKDEVEAILKEFRIMNADVVIRSEVSAEDFIDCIEDNKKYVPGITVVNKVDTVSAERKRELREDVDPDLFISATKGTNVEELKDMIYEELGLISIYMKEPRKDADMEEPLIIGEGATINDICSKLHRDFENKFRYARIWGESAKFPGQRQGLDHEVKDEDIVEIHLQ